MNRKKERKNNKKEEMTQLVGVVFDMDGTLTLPSNLNLHEYREKYGIPNKVDIMDFLGTLEPEKFKAAYDEILAIEARGRETLELQPGIHELLMFITAHKLKTAIVTRNARLAVDTLLEKLDGFQFDIAISRDDHPNMPHKPDPAPIYEICREWGTTPSSVVMVGDYLHDIECGNNAGAESVLLLNEKNSAFIGISTYTIKSLPELCPILASRIEK